MSEPAYRPVPAEPERPAEPEHEHVHAAAEPARPTPAVPIQQPVDRHAEAVSVERTTPMKTLAPGRGLLRALLALVGIAGIVTSAFLVWVNQTDAIRLSDRVFFTTTFGTTSKFVASAGFVAIVIGLIGLLGLASINGWPTRLGGALGIAAFVLVLITLGRSSRFSLPEDIGPGLWLLLAGSLVCTIAGLVPATRIVERRDVTTATT